MGRAGKLAGGAGLLTVCFPALLAALGLSLFEVLHAWLAGTVVLGGPVQGLVLGLSITGVLGPPVWALALLSTGLWALARAGWRFSAPDAVPNPQRRAAWVVFGLIALAVTALSVQVTVVWASAVMKKPVYQGLAAGLVGAGSLVAFGALGGVLHGGLTRAFGALSRRLPPALDPTRGAVAASVLLAAAILVGLLAPKLLPELHSVSLAPAWLALLALALFGLGHGIAVRAVARAPRAVSVALVLGLLGTAGGTFLAARTLGDRQTRLLAMDRDTLLVGALLKRARTLFDRDGDGVSAVFGGHDCDDRNAALRPGGYDLPDNKVDENCTGADLVLRQDPLKAPQRPTPVGLPKPWNVVFVTLDAVRADRARALMPNLAALAAESIDYRQAYSHGAATYWSIPALMASTVPSRLELGPDQTPVEKEVLLAEVLRDAGWYTGLYANVTIFFVRGLKQGTEYQNYATSDFTRHGDTPGAEHLTQGMLSFIDRRRDKASPDKTRFFLWGHYYDPHDPYGEVPGFPARDGSDSALYDANLQYVDAHLGKLVAGLKSRGLWDTTVFVVTADHGDEFLEHGHRFHGTTLYEEMIHVPLILRVPGLAARVIDGPIGHMEVAPTLLELLNVKIPARFLGRSRANELRTGVEDRAAPVYAEVLPDSNYGSHQVALIQGETKLIQRLGEGYSELYDLAGDPGERQNLFDDAPEAAELAARLGVYVDHHLFALAQGKSGARVPPGKKGASSAKGP